MGRRTKFRMLVFIPFLPAPLFLCIHKPLDLSTYTKHLSAVKLMSSMSQWCQWCQPEGRKKWVARANQNWSNRCYERCYALLVLHTTFIILLD
jgi:hypothetical protein